MRNLIYPLNWEECLPMSLSAFLKPYAGGGWKHVYKVDSPEEFFENYNRTGDLCMSYSMAWSSRTITAATCGAGESHIMKYDPKLRTMSAM